MRLCIALPALNEERIIVDSCRRVIAKLQRDFAGVDWRVIVADNGSTDGTQAAVEQLAAQEPRLSLLRIPQRGKGFAIKGAWQAADADGYVFMDADLATDLAALPILVSAVTRDGFDVAIGSRYAPGAVVERDVLRRLTSRGYQLVLKTVLGTSALDAPCGFKAITRRVRDAILPHVQSGAWFFDSELLVLAERAGFTIKEIPVRWREPDVSGRSSKVKIFSLSWQYLRAVLALRRRLKREHQAVSSKQ